MRVEVRDREVLKALARLQARMANLRPAMQVIGDVIVADTSLTFRDSRDPWGHPWRPLAPATVEKRRHGKGFGSDKPLVNFGHLAASFSAQADARSVTVGTNWMADRITGGAAIHQFGGQAGRGHKVTIPARPFLPIRGDEVVLSVEQKASVLAILEMYLRP